MRKYMRSAIENARIAYSEGEVPVGAVMVYEGKIIAQAHNTCKNKKNPLHHAEMQLIEDSIEKLNTPCLKGCELYVTLEPCPMCAGAIIHSGISKVVFGSYDTEFGSLGSYLNLTNHPFAKNIEVYGGICETECKELIQNFFKEIRNAKN